MKTRIISGLCMLPLIVFLILRGIPLAVGMLIVTGVAVYEFISGFEKLEIRPSLTIAFMSLFLLYFWHILPYEWTGEYRHELLLLWLVVSIVACFMYIFPTEKRKLEDGMATIVTIVYVEFFLFHMVLIDETSYGVLVWMVVITAFGTDIAAYFTGYCLGKHKLCPNLSPKKTVEGAIGGVLGSVILSVIFGLIVKIQIFPHIVVMGIVGSIMSQLGDLSASAFKRKMGIKDYGNLIPGHGGIMDRFDSILFTAPAIYYYLQIVIQR